MTTHGKKLLVLLLTVMMVFTFSVTAFAADIAIQLDGQNVPMGDVAPVTKDYRNYVPFRTVFEAMGADVAWDQATNSITAKRDGITVQFIVGDKNVNVTKDGKTQTVATDAASFLQNDSTLVPVRFAAQALGANVGWDEEKQTVVIIDTAKLAAKYEGKFTILDKYFAYSKKFATSPYKTTGDFSADIKMTSDGQTIPMTMKGTMDGIIFNNDGEFKMTMNLNMDDLLAMMAKEDPTATQDPQFKEMVAQLKDIKLNAIANLSNGKVYINMPLLNTTFGKAATDDVWFVMDYNQIMATAGMSDMWNSLLGMSKGDSNTTDIISMLIGFVPLDSVQDYTDLQEMISMVEGLAGDTAFVKNSNGYVSKFEKTIDGLTVSFEFVLNTNAKDEVTAYDMKINAKNAEIDMAIQAGMDANMKSTAKITMNMTDPYMSMMMNMMMNMQYTATSDKPATAPGKDATIIDLIGMANAPISTETSVTSVTTVPVK